MAEVKRYALGFCFDDAMLEVVLIQKKRPDWQAGLLNGLGGHVEKRETPREAMAREFEEEAGVKTKYSDWSCFAHMAEQSFSSPWEVYCFRLRSTEVFANATTMTDEPVVKEIIPRLFQRRDRMPNLTWLIALAVDWRSGDVRSPVRAYITYPKTT